MIILGVNSGLHDGSAALLRDGEITCVVETERLVRHKQGWGVPPAQSISACLRNEKLSMADVDAIAVGWDVPRLASLRGHGFSVTSFVRWLQDKDAPEISQAGGAEDESELDGAGQALAAKLHFVPHHLAHAASGYYTGRNSDALVLVADGIGEQESVSIYEGRGGVLRELAQWKSTHSLGRFYGNAARWAGFGYWGGGKLMGLAAYGQPCEPVPLRPSSNDLDLPALWQNSELTQFEGLEFRAEIEEWFNEHCYPYRRSRGQEVMAYANFAASIQESLNHTLAKLCNSYAERNELSHLVLTGGVACNCATTGYLKRTSAFHEVYVPPFPHDVGVAVGAAIVTFNQLNDAHDSIQPKQLVSAALGVAGLDKVPESLVTKYELKGLDFKILSSDQITTVTATMLRANRVVCWHQGRPEIGQRALGQRSILANPTKRENLIRVNEMKGREIWRPLAPSIHRDDWETLFGESPSPVNAFMLSAETLRENWRPKLPAITHVDGTCRPQCVDPKEQPLFARLLDEIRSDIGAGVVINTSFNLAGEPMVHDAESALNTFLRSQFDALIIGNMLVTHGNL